MQKMKKLRRTNDTKVYKSGYVDVNDVPIYYQVVGNAKKKSMVLLHGNGENHKVFKGQVAHYEKYYQLVLIDSRGHGKSGVGTEKLNFEIMANDVIGVLNQLHIQQAIVLGFSDGANIAVHLALQAPERLKEMIIISGNIYPEGLKGWFRILINTSYYFWMILEHLRIGNYKKHQQSALMAIYPTLSMQDLEQIQIRTLFLAASNDIVSRQHTIEMAERMPNAKYVIIHNAKHMSLYSKPEDYFKQIDEFLEETNELIND